VPKPENEGTYSENELMVQKVPSIYSNSEGEDCARLVKNGQLDNFTPVRSIKRQEISHFVDGLDSDSGRQGRSTSRRLTQRSKSEHRGRTVERDTILQRGSRSSSRDQIKVGDRVIIKDKYIGTCRYVGPIEEQDFQLPEIWYGVELDEKLTNNSGIFGSREYFSCAFGHGLMVLGAKIRKVKTPNVSFKNGPSTTTLRPSKSMSNLTTRTKVSIGAENWESRKSRKSFNNQHPMATLNRIKQLQAMQPAGYARDPYRALLETFQQGSTGGGYAHDNLMRRSFERIVSQESPDYGLSRNQSLPVMHNPEQLMTQFGHLQRSTSAPQYRKSAEI